MKTHVCGKTHSAVHENSKENESTQTSTSHEWVTQTKHCHSPTERRADKCYHMEIATRPEWLLSLSSTRLRRISKSSPVCLTNIVRCSFKIKKTFFFKVKNFGLSSSALTYYDFPVGWGIEGTGTFWAHDLGSVFFFIDIKLPMILIPQPPMSNKLIWACN